MEANYFKCACHSDEHTLTIYHDTEDNELYVHVFLNDYDRWYIRVWKAVKYVFGYKSKYGHWDEIVLNKVEINKLKDLFEKASK